MTRPIIAHGRSLEIVAQDGLPGGWCGVALVGESGVPVRAQQGPCAQFRADDAVQVLDTARAGMNDALERLHDALARESPRGPALPVLTPDQPMRRWPWMPGVLAAALALAAYLYQGAHDAAQASGGLMLVLLVLNFVVGMARRPPDPDPDVSALGWPAFGWGLGTFVLWGGYSELERPSGSLLSLLPALVLVGMAGLAAGHWLRSVLLTSGAAPPPLPVILSPGGEVAAGPALYSVSWNGRLYPSLGVPCGPGGLALLSVGSALARRDVIPRFAQRVLLHTHSRELDEERRSELHERVTAVEDALRSLDADR